MLAAIALTKQYGSRCLFADLSWQVQKGDRVGLIGPNGAGKTTLLRVLAGAEAADSGQVSCSSGERLGYLPQEAPRVAGGSILDRVMDAAADVRGMLQRLDDIATELEAASPEGAMVLATEHAELSERLNLLEGYSLEARAREVLGGLGFAQGALLGPVTELSGGWWMRVELARLLLTRPNYLLLDEPTNHLDGESLAFLEHFLQNYAGAWVVVSHDRYFLNRRVNQVAELTPEGLVSFAGNYDAFLAWRDAQDAQAARTAQNQAKERAALTAFIDRFGAKASKAAQAQSRVKALARMQPVAPARARARTLNFRLPEPARAGAWLVHLEGVSKNFGEKHLFGGLDLQIRRGDRIAVVGANGTGKSTLLKMLAGTLAPDSGQRHMGHNVVPYYFAQHQLDVLNPQQTVLAQMQAVVPPLTPIAQIRGLLGAFLFSQDSVNKTISVLSGGEKSRLVLACMLAARPNLLLLDEPTNHLDLPSRSMLEAALTDYSGTLVCISHDRYFLDCVAQKVIEITATGRVHVFDGHYSAYAASQEKQSPQQLKSVQTKKKKKAGANGPHDTNKLGCNTHIGDRHNARHSNDATPPQEPKPHPQQHMARREQARLQKQITVLETQIAAAEARRDAIDALLCDPQVYADASQCNALLAERTILQAQLAEQVAHWETLARALT